MENDRMNLFATLKYNPCQWKNNNKKGGEEVTGVTI